MPEWLILILGSAVSGGLGAFFGYLGGRKTDEANATKIFTDIALSLVEPLNKRIIVLEKQNGRYAKRVLYLMRGIEQLLSQIVNLGQAPCWEPDEWNPEEDESPEKVNP